MSDDVFVLVELGNPALFFESSVDLFFLLHNMGFRQSTCLSALSILLHADVALAYCGDASRAKRRALWELRRTRLGARILETRRR